MKFSEILKEILLENNFSQTQLAKRINVKPSQVSEWLKGKANPGYDTLKLIATCLDISTDYLLGLEDDFGVRTADAMHDAYTSEEREIISKYRRLPDKIKKLIRDQLEVYGERSELLPDKNKKV